MPNVTIKDLTAKSMRQAGIRVILNFVPVNERVLIESETDGEYEEYLMAESAPCQRIDITDHLLDHEINKFLHSGDAGSEFVEVIGFERLADLGRKLNLKIDGYTSESAIVTFALPGSVNGSYLYSVKGSSTIMSKDKTDKLKGNALQAATRTAVTKLVKGTQKPIAALVKKQVGGTKGTAAAALLNTPDGQALVAGVLGILQLILPQLQGETAQLIGDELRTQAMAHATNQVGDLLDPIIDLFAQAAESLPKLT